MQPANSQALKRASNRTDLTGHLQGIPEAHSPELKGLLDRRFPLSRSLAFRGVTQLARSKSEFALERRGHMALRRKSRRKGNLCNRVSS